MGVYTNQGNWLSRRGMFLMLLVLFHIVLIWGLKSGFAMKMVAAVMQPIEAEIINDVEEDVAPPPPPPPKMEIPPVEVPPPVVNIVIAPDAAPTTALSNVTDRPQPPPPPAPVATIPRTALSLNKKASQPSTAEYYPPTSQRLGEEGSTKVKICVGVNGRVTTATTEETSGFERLDEAAIKVAKLYRFNPATENGKPVEACATLPVKFNLKEDGR